MAYAYDERKVSTLLHGIIRRNLPERAEKWFDDQQAQWQQNGSIQQFNMAFSAAPRFLGRNEVDIDLLEAHALMLFKINGPQETKETRREGDTVWEEAAFPQGIYSLPIAHYTLDRLFRVWWLLQLPVTDKARYIECIENLFNSAEMNELVALYGALPLLAFPEEWKARTAEGIRSNIGSVLEAIMLDNPYPGQYLDEAAWNQLVLKAFFTDKPVHQIAGLDERANPALARTLVDLAHERWAAGRPVNPMLWRLVAPFIDATNFADIERAWHSEYHADREAAALACSISSYPPALALLQKRPDVAEDIAEHRLTWDTVAARING